MVDRKATICLVPLAATFITVVSVAPQARALAITRVNVVDVVAMHAGNQSFFLKQPEVVGILKNLAEVGKVVTRDMAMVGVGILAGCDAMIAGCCVHDELAAMVAGGAVSLLLHGDVEHMLIGRLQPMCLRISGPSVIRSITGLDHVALSPTGVAR